MMKKHSNIIIVVFISVFALLINVGSYGVIETSDARYADISREMYVSKDYIHPNLIGVHHYHKPPLTYQISSIGLSLFGVNSFGVRFFLQIAVLAQIILVYALSLLLFSNKKKALWAAMIYFSFPIVLISSRNLTTDAFLTTFALLSIYAWVSYRKKNIIGYLYLFAISLALGFLTKGPVIFIIPLSFIVFYNYTEPAKRKVGLSHLVAFFLFLVIGFSWYLYLGYQNPDFIDYFLGKQTIDRFSKNVFNREEPFWYFIVYAPAMGIPWLLLLPYLIKKNQSLFLKRSIYFTLLLSVILPLIFFSISSSKRILYILPIYSLMAILIPQLLHLMNINEKDRIHRIILYFSIIILLIFIITPFLNIGFHVPIFLAVLALFFVVVIFGIYRSKIVSTINKPVYYSFLIAFFLLIGGSTIMSRNELKIHGTKPITDFIVKNNLKDRNILLFNTRKPSIAFGLNKSIISINAGSRHLKRETQFENDLKWKNYLIDCKNQQDLKYLETLLKAPNVVLVYKQSFPDNLKWIISLHHHKKTIDNWTLYY